MNKEFQEKLRLYNEGKLNAFEAAEIEHEIDKFTAISNYLDDDDKVYIEELKQQMTSDNEKENKPVKLLKSRINFRIITTTMLTVFAASIIIIFLFFLVSKITTSLFGLNYKESYVARETVVQLARIFQPQYESHRSGVERYPFAKQNIHISLDNIVGNTIIDQTEINVRYSFGNPVSSGSTEIPQLLPITGFYMLNSYESDSVPDFTILENAPQGTKAQIYIEFNKTLTPQQLKENIINSINNIEFIPMAAIDSKFVLSNPSYYKFMPVYPYNDDNAKLFEDKNLKQIQYDNMDDLTHKESLISNLNLIKNNQRLLQIMYYEDLFYDIHIDDVIKHVEDNSIEYVGMYISADINELLILKDNPLILYIRVENIVLW
ncbi:MAG: anti sigma factor C-terminal domain-containing protein [Eubacteriales bacterium]